MRTIAALLKNNPKVYVCFASNTLCRYFLKNAEEEGFAFGTSVLPTQKEPDSVLILKSDWTICYLNSISQMAFRANLPINVVNIPKVDYGKYLAGWDDYSFSKE